MPPQQMLNVRSHSSLLWVTMLPPPLIPALLNNKWILSVWWRPATSSRNRSTCVRSATSAMCVVTRSPCGNPAASQSLCVSAKPVGETSHIATLQASATSWRTSSRPIPLPPPVTTAVLPANWVMCVLPCVLAPIQIWPSNLPSPPVRGYSDLQNRATNFTTSQLGVDRGERSSAVGPDRGPRFRSRGPDFVNLRFGHHVVSAFGCRFVSFINEARLSRTIPT